MADKVKCTWMDPDPKPGGTRCQHEAEHIHRSKDGQAWANLCAMHNAMLDAAMAGKEFNAGRMLRAWVRASGGAKVLADRLAR